MRATYDGTVFNALVTTRETSATRRLNKLVEPRMRLRMQFVRCVRTTRNGVTCDW